MSKSSQENERQSSSEEEYEPSGPLILECRMNEAIFYDRKDPVHIPGYEGKAVDFLSSGATEQCCPIAIVYRNSSGEIDRAVMFHCDATTDLTDPKTGLEAMQQWVSQGDLSQTTCHIGRKSQEAALEDVGSQPFFRTAASSHTPVEYREDCSACMTLDTQTGQMLGERLSGTVSNTTALHGDGAPEIGYFAGQFFKPLLIERLKEAFFKH